MMEWPRRLGAKLLGAGRMLKQGCRRLSAPGPTLFVTVGFVLLAVQLFTFIRTYGVDAPFYDEWELVPALTGHQPITLEWLWSQHNEHRILLPRLVYLAVLKIARYNFRAMYSTIAVLLTLGSAGLLLAARRLRGRFDYADLFLPMVVMTVGQFENLLWGFQIAFILPGAILLLVVILAIWRPKIDFVSALGILVATLASPLSGGAGLALAPAFVACTVLNGLELRKGPRGWARAAVLWTGAAITIGIVLAYFVGYQRPEQHTPNENAQEIVKWTQDFLLNGLGNGAEVIKDGAHSFLVIIASATLLMLLWVFIVRPAERFRVLRLATVFGALASLAIGIGWARSGFVSAFRCRYVSLGAPFWCACYVAWQLPRWRSAPRVMQMVLFVAAVALLVPNRDRSVGWGTGTRDSRMLLLKDLSAGVGAAELARRHYSEASYGGESVLVERMKMLRASGVRRWKALKD
jgi:hypothetical protein